MRNLHLSSALIAIICGNLVAGISVQEVPEGSFSDQIDARDAYWSAKDLVPVRPPGPPPKRSHKLAAKVSLGLRYSVLKLNPQEGSFEEVPLDTEFHSGDSVRFNVSSDREGYLYVIQQGSSGAWTPLYPRAGSSESNNLLPGKNYQVPSDPHIWTFRGNPGQEKLFVLLTLRPERDLDQTIASLKAGGQGGSQTISTQVIEGISGSRDIVEESIGGDAGHYVVTPAADPHVLINVTLNHQ